MGDADIVISTPFSADTYKKPDVPIFTEDIDPILMKYSSSLKEHAYLLPDLPFQLHGEKIRTYAQDRTQSSEKETIQVYGMSPSVKLDKSIKSAYSSNPALGETETLYTARGEQGMGTVQSLVDSLGIVTSEDTYDSLVRWHYVKQSEGLLGKTETYQLKRTLFTLKSKPNWSNAS